MLGRLLTISRLIQIGELADSSIFLLALPDSLGFYPICFPVSRLGVALRNGPLCYCVCVGAMSPSIMCGDLVVVPVVVVGRRVRGWLEPGWAGGFSPVVE